MPDPFAPYLAQPAVKGTADPFAAYVDVSTPKPATPHEKTWTDTAVDALPMIGGTVGSFVGAGKWNPLGMAGAAAGGAGGAFLKQIVNAARGSDDVPSTVGGQVEDAAEQAALQAGIQGGGRVIMKGIKAIAPYAWPVTKGALAHTPVVGPMGRGAIQAARETATDLAAKNIERPSNLAAARQAVFNLAKSSNTAVDQAGVADLLEALRGTAEDAGSSVASHPDAWTGAPGQILPEIGKVATKAGNRGAASFGPRGDLGAWIQNKLATEAITDPRIKALLDAFGRPIHR